MVLVERDAQGEVDCIVLRPNFSLSWKGNLWVLAGLGLVAFGTAAFMAQLGAWPVFPFAGLEIGGLLVALYVLLHRNSHQEVLRFSTDSVRIEKGRFAPTSGWQCARAWAQAVVISSRHPWYPPRVAIRSHGKEVEVGAFLSLDDLDLLIAELSGLIQLARIR